MPNKDLGVVTSKIETSASSVWKVQKALSERLNGRISFMEQRSFLDKRKSFCSKFVL